MSTPVNHGGPTCQPHPLIIGYTIIILNETLYMKYYIANTIYVDQKSSTATSDGSLEDLKITALISSKKQLSHSAHGVAISIPPFKVCASSDSWRKRERERERERQKERDRETTMHGHEMQV